jgi:hypothetical protein
MLVNRNVTVPDGGRTGTLAPYVKVTGILGTEMQVEGPRRGVIETTRHSGLRSAQGRPTA